MDRMRGISAGDYMVNQGEQKQAIDKQRQEEFRG